jgi:leader peptidase (prepilin peptidase)/N-methyltransferase
MRYPLVEALTCFASVYVAWRFGFSDQTYLQTIAALLFTWTLIALTFIDIDTRLLPDQLTFFLIGLGLFFSLFGVFCTTYEAIIGLIAGYLIFSITQTIFYWITGKVGMGQGDYKLLGGLGAFLGWKMLPLIILLASVTGIFFSLTHMTVKQEFKSTQLPFGPYLSLGGWISLIWGSEIIHLYLRAFM